MNIMDATPIVMSYEMAKVMGFKDVVKVPN